MSMIEDTRFTLFSCLASLFLCGLLAAEARASVGPSDEGQNTYILGGESTGRCQFPSAVSVIPRNQWGRAVCSGTLIHPKVVVTAAHCVERAIEVKVGFGERSLAPEFELDAECVVSEGSGRSRAPDVAFCELSEEVTQAPIVPILMGCELAALKKGTPVVTVGFGKRNLEENGPDQFDLKSHAMTKVYDAIGVDTFRDDEILLEGEGKGACRGDSGAPTYVDLRTLPGFENKKGAGWRVFGVASYMRSTSGASCGDLSGHALIHTVVAEFEKKYGLDVTPCFDADGTWNPGPDCKNFPDPFAGGDWDACDPGEASGYSHTCGDNPHGVAEPESGCPADVQGCPLDQTGKNGLLAPLGLSGCFLLRRRRGLK